MLSTDRYSHGHADTEQDDQDLIAEETSPRSQPCRRPSLAGARGSLLTQAVAEKHLSGGAGGGPRRMERTGPVAAVPQPAPAPQLAVLAPAQALQQPAAVTLLPEELSGLGALLSSLSGTRGAAGPPAGPVPAGTYGAGAALQGPPGYAPASAMQPVAAAAAARPPPGQPELRPLYQPQPTGPSGPSSYAPSAAQAYAGHPPPAAAAPAAQYHAGVPPAAAAPPANGYAGPADVGPGPGQQPRGAPRAANGAVDEEALFDRLGSHFVGSVRHTVGQSRGDETSHSWKSVFVRY